MTGMTSRRGLAALMLAAAAMPMVGAGPNVLHAGEPLPTLDLPKSARGNGYRGYPGSKPAFNRAKANRRRKLALQSKRRNRR